MRAPVLGKDVCLQLLLMVRCKEDRTYLEKADRNTDGDTGAPQRTLVIRDGPRVASKGFEDASELELTLLGWHEEAGSTKGLCGDRLPRSRCGTVLRAQPEHVLDLLRGVLLPAAEHVGLAAFSIPELVHLGLIGRGRMSGFMLETDRVKETHHRSEGDQANQGVWRDQAQADDQCISESLQILLL